MSVVGGSAIVAFWGVTAAFDPNRTSHCFSLGAEIKNFATVTRRAYGYAGDEDRDSADADA